MTTAPSPDDPERARLPQFALWAPFAALICAYAVAIFVAALLGAVVSAAGGEVSQENLPNGIVLAATLVQDALLIAFAVAFARAGGIAPTPATFGLRRVSWRAAVPAAIATFAIFYLFLLVWTVAINSNESDDLAKDLGAEDSAVNLIGVAVLVAIAAPIAEELFFRGFLFAALSRGIGWIAGAIVTGIIFAGVHAGGTPAVFLPPLAVLGLLLCWLYRRTGSLLPGMGVHAVNNALALGVTLGWALWQVVAVAVAAPLIVLGGALRIADV